MFSKPLTYYRWPAGIILFFVALAVFNFWFVSLAFHQHAELMESNPYEKGLDYQKVIDAAQLKEDLGWKSITTISTADANDERRITLQIRNKEGSPVSGVSVDVLAISPSNSSQDLKLRLVADPTTPGTYSAQAKLRKGAWIFQFMIKENGQSVAFREQLKAP